MCPSQSQYAGVPRNMDGEVTADVIHATHPFGHVPSLRHSVNVVLDEQPDFRADITHDRAQRAVTAFLQLTDVGPDTWEELVSTARAVPDNDLAKPWNEHAKPENHADREVFQNAVEALEHGRVRRPIQSRRVRLTRRRYLRNAISRILSSIVLSSASDGLRRQWANVVLTDITVDSQVSDN